MAKMRFVHAAMATAGQQTRCSALTSPASGTTLIAHAQRSSIHLLPILAISRAHSPQATFRSSSQHIVCFLLILILYFRGLSVVEIVAQTCPRDYAPKVAVVLASGKLGVGTNAIVKILGACESEANPACAISAVLNQSIVQFQKNFLMRYVIGTGDCAVVIVLHNQKHLQQVTVTG